MTAPVSPRRPRRLDALTGVRFFAAIHVVVFHNEGLFERAPWTVRQIIHHGYSGVSLFFILSGLILAYNYLGPGATSIDRRAFWIARFVRIYPAYLLGLVLALPLFLYYLARTLPAAEAAQKGLIVAVPSLLLVQAWIPYSLGELNAPGWSLSVEAFLYGMFPLVGVWLARWRTPALVGAIVALWIVSCAPATIHDLFAPDGQRQMLPGPDWIRPRYPMWNLLFTNPLLHLAQFSTGVAAGVLLLRRRTRDAHIAHGVSGLSTIAEAGLLALLALTFIAASSGWPTDTLLNVGFLAVVYVPLLLVLAVGNGAVARFLALPAVVLLGEASYGIYILQDPVLTWMRLMGRLAGFEWTLPFFLLYLGVLTGVAIAALRAEERLRPALRSALQRRWASTPRPTPPVVVRT